MTSTSQDSVSSGPAGGLWGLRKDGLQGYHVHYPCPEPVLASIPLDLSRSTRAIHRGNIAPGSQNGTTTVAGSSCACPESPHDETSEGSFNGISIQQMMEGRAYACHNCLRHPGFKAFNVAYSDYGRHIWGVDKPGRQHDGVPTPQLGCSCGQRLVQSTLCRSHQVENASNWVRSTQMVKAWMDQMWGAKLCPFCLSDPTGESPIDVYAFKGRQGGEDLPEIIYMCLSCQDIVVVPREIGMGPIPSAATAASASPTGPASTGPTTYTNMGMDGGSSVRTSPCRSREEFPAANDPLATEFAAGLWDDVAAAQNRSLSPQGMSDPFDFAMGGVPDFIESNANSAGALLDLYQDQSAISLTTSPQATPQRITAGPAVFESSPRHSSPGDFVAFDDFLHFSPSPPANPVDAPAVGNVAPAAGISSVLNDNPFLEDDFAPLENDFGDFMVANSGEGMPYNGEDEDHFMGGVDDNNASSTQSSQSEENTARQSPANTDLGWVPSPPSMSWAEAQALAAAAMQSSAQPRPNPSPPIVSPASGLIIPSPPSMTWTQAQAIAAATAQSPAQPEPEPLLSFDSPVINPAHAPSPAQPSAPQAPAPSTRMSPIEAAICVQRARINGEARGEIMTPAEQQLLYAMLVGDAKAVDEHLREVYPSHEATPSPPPAPRRPRRPAGSRTVNRRGRGAGPATQPQAAMPSQPAIASPVPIAPAPAPRQSDGYIPPTQTRTPDFTARRIPGYIPSNHPHAYNNGYTNPAPAPPQMYAPIAPRSAPRSVPSANTTAGPATGGQPSQWQYGGGGNGYSGGGSAMDGHVSLSGSQAAREEVEMVNARAADVAESMSGLGVIDEEMADAGEGDALLGGEGTGEGADEPSFGCWVEKLFGKRLLRE